VQLGGGTYLLKYKHLTTFYGSIDSALAFSPDGSTRYFNSVHDAIQEAVKLKAEGPFTLVTRVELIPDGERNRGDNQNGGPPIYWEPTVRKAPDPADEQRAETRRALQNDLYSALINLGSKKGDAIAIARALPNEITELSPALNWAMRRK
jgi:hypothetical protein